MKQKVFLGVSMKVARPYSEIKCHFFDELRFHSSITTNLFLLCIIYYTNSHLAKNASGNNFFLFYFYLKYYVEDIVCKSQAHWNISRIFRVAVMATTPYYRSKIDKKSFFFTIFFWAFFITPETCHAFLIKPYHSKKKSKTSHTHCEP